MPPEEDEQSRYAAWHLQVTSMDDRKFEPWCFDSRIGHVRDLLHDLWVLAFRGWPSSEPRHVVLERFANAEDAIMKSAVDGSWARGARGLIERTSVRMTVPSGVDVMISRDETWSGYWDHPVTTSEGGFIANFRGFFDWEEDRQDGEGREFSYSSGVIGAFPGRPECVAHWCLVRFEHCEYSRE